MFTGFRGNIKACYMARNGRSAMATDGESLLQFDLMKREVMKQRKLGRTTSGEAAAFSPDGTFVAVANGYQIHLWNLNSTGELPVCDQGDTIWTLTFTPDGNRLLSGGAGVVNIWDFKKQRKIYSQQTSGSYYVQSIATAPDNKHYAAVPSSAGQDLQVFRLPP